MRPSEKTMIEALNAIVYELQAINEKLELLIKPEDNEAAYRW
jgi:hypothetical protein